MSRLLTVAAAQLGPIHRADDRASVVRRMIALMEQAKARGADFIVYPELALTTFVPRWYCEDRAEADQWFEAAMPGPDTQPLSSSKMALRKPLASAALATSLKAHSRALVRM